MHTSYRHVSSLHMIGSPAFCRVLGATYRAYMCSLCAARADENVEVRNGNSGHHPTSTEGAHFIHDSTMCKRLLLVDDVMRTPFVIRKNKIQILI